MKSFTLTFTALTLLSTSTGYSQGSPANPNQSLPAPTPYAVVTSGANSRVWEQTTYEVSRSGKILPRKHDYTELATGLNYLDDGQWIASKEEIDVLPQGGAAATNGQHQVYFPSDIYAGTIQLMTPDGKLLQSRPLGISYDDGNNTVMIAFLTNSVGTLVGSNQVIYPDAFVGIAADLRYTYTKAGFEQDIILLEQLPAPEAGNLNPATTRLQVLTEFFNPPQPALTSTPLPAQAGIAMTDQSLDFGVMKMMQGRAFLLGTAAEDAGVLVGKSWLQVGGRQFLVEEAPVAALANQLAALPIYSMDANRTGERFLAAHKLQLPPQRSAKANASEPPMQMARSAPPSKGLVFDYQTLSSSVTNWVFQSDATYYISGTVNLSGTNTFEGGTILKYASNATIVVGTVNWQGAPYRPVIFTAKDDNTVGDSVSGSSGNPAGYYANPALTINTSGQTFSDFRIVYAKQGISTPSTSESFYNGQFVNCQNGLTASSATDFLRNVLFSNVKTNFNNLSSATVDVQNGTFGSNACVATVSTGVNLFFTNCVFGNVSNLYSGTPVAFTGGYNGFYKSPAFGGNQNTNTSIPFQTVGGGKYYLTNGCAFISVGTANIDPILGSNLWRSTTYAPVAYTNITTNGTWNITVQRDNNSVPSLGYHYDPIDYAVCEVTISGTLTLGNGVAVAVFQDNSFGYISPGFYLSGSGSSSDELVSTGTPQAHNQICTYHSVQEQPVAWGGNSLSYVTMIDVAGPNYNTVAAPEVLQARFTDFIGISGMDPGWPDGNVIFADTMELNMQDCRVGPGGFNWELFQGDGTVTNRCVNNVFERASITLDELDGTSPLMFYNNLIRNGTVYCNSEYSSTNFVWAIKDNLFDGDGNNILVTGNSGQIVYDHNAYLNTAELTPTSTSDIILSNFTYAAGLLGAYYQASGDLIDMGDVGADKLGLYYYTVRTNQLPETNSTVDIGFHYYALDTNGLSYWWELKYFGQIGLNPSSDPANDGNNLLYDFTNGIDPNIISFSLSFPNQYVTSSTATGTVAVLGGVPSYYAVLADSTNFTSATWSAYTSSNLTVNLGSTQGAHDVWIGLRGLPSDAQQTWEETTLILDSLAPTITITNPANNASFNASRVNVSGNFTAASLQQITVNGIPAFINGTNYVALNVPVAAGTNVITAIIADFTGATNAASIIIIGSTNSDGSLSDPVQIQATPVAGFSPLSATFQIVSNNAPGTFQQAVYDFNGDGIVDFVTNTLGTVTVTYTNGQYFPVVTIQTTIGFFSSSGGWNSSDPNRVQITVQSTPTQTTFASITDPVDLKWQGTNLYVLSSSGATITAFNTNGSSVRSLNLGGGAPSGIGVDGAGNVYVAMTSSNQVWKFYPTNATFAADPSFGSGGHIGKTDGSSGSATSQFNAPFDVAVSPDGGTISVSDSGNNRIQQFSATDGSFSAVFGTNGADIGDFSTPKGLAYDSVGTLYIVDSGNSRVALAVGTFVQGVTGTGGTALVQLSGPVNISIGQRAVYVADTGNNRIQSLSTAAPHSLFSIDSTSIRFAVSSGLNAPAGVAEVDSLTNEIYYVADTGNNRILLYTVSNNDLGAIFAVWSSMTNRVAAGDVSGALAYFSVAAVDQYQQAFLSVGIASSISAMSQAGALMPVYINDDRAEYYFTNTISGQIITFPVEFDKENGVWKIMDF